jgi:hypothetical protein
LKQKKKKNPKMNNSKSKQKKKFFVTGGNPGTSKTVGVRPTGAICIEKAHLVMAKKIVVPETEEGHDFASEIEPFGS